MHVVWSTSKALWHVVGQVALTNGTEVAAWPKIQHFERASILTQEE